MPFLITGHVVEASAVFIMKATYLCLLRFMKIQTSYIDLLHFLEQSLFYGDESSPDCEVIVK